MTNTVSIDDVLSKFVANEVDSTEVIKLLLTSDETGIDFLQNLKKDFKDRYVTPTFNKAKDYYSKIGKKIDDPTSSKDVLNHINDPLGLKELRDEYKKKSEEILKKNLDKLDLNLKLDSNNSISTRNSLSEQQTLTEKTPTVSLSDETVDKLGGVLSGINAENLKRSGNRVSQEESSGDGGGLLGTLGALLLAGGVGALLISAFWDKHIKPWLESKLNLNLDVFDKFEGVVEGIGKFFTMGGLKITSGWFFNLVGKAFTTFGDILEGGLKAIFKLGFGDDVVKAGATAAPAAWKTLIPRIAGGLFKGVGAVAFKSIPIIGSLISFYNAWDRFKNDDTIAGIIELVGGISNLLVFTPLAPLALPLSIGASALNAFLDYKAGGANTMEEKQAIKMDYVNKIVEYIQEIPIVGGLIKWGRGFWELGKGNWKGALNYLTETPFLGPFPAILQALVNSNLFGTEGNENFSWDTFSDEIRKSMFRWMCSFIPKIGGLRGAVAAWLGVKYDDNTGNLEIDEDYLVGENGEALSPEQIRARKHLKNVTEKPVSKFSQEQLDNTQKLIDDQVNKVQQLKEQLEAEIKNRIGPSIPFIHDKSRDERVSEAMLDRANWQGTSHTERELKQQLDVQETTLKSIRERKNQLLNLQVDQSVQEKKQQDFSFRNLMTSTQSNSILFDNKTNTANVLDQGDNILAYKTDEVFDRALKELTELAKSINKGIYKIPEKLENINTESSPVVVSNNSGERSNMMDVILSGTRPDSIYNFRRSIQGEFA
jgi:hypothetical protein